MNVNTPAPSADLSLDPNDFVPDDVLVEITKLQESTAWTVLKIPVLLGIWLACAVTAIYADTLLVQIPCWIIIGFVLHGFGVFVHEAAHNMLFRKWWIDRFLGFLLSLTIIFPCSSYRATHMLHHWYANTDKDSDNLEANFPNKIIRSLVFYVWCLVGYAALRRAYYRHRPFSRQGMG